jgi:hypothetical protein
MRARVCVHGTRALVCACVHACVYMTRVCVCMWVQGTYINLSPLEGSGGQGGLRPAAEVRVVRPYLVTTVRLIARRLWCDVFMGS